MYYDYLMKEALKNNEIKQFLIGEGKYKENETHFGENMQIDYEARLKYICEYQIPNKVEFDYKISRLIINLLQGKDNEFYAGICYVRSMCYLLDDSMKLQIDEKQFFTEVKKIVRARELELKNNNYNNANFNNMWEFVEYNNAIIEQGSGLSIM